MSNKNRKNEFLSESKGAGSKLKDDRVGFRDFVSDCHCLQQASIWRPVLSSYFLCFHAWAPSYSCGADNNRSHLDKNKIHTCVEKGRSWCCWWSLFDGAVSLCKKKETLKNIRNITVIITKLGKSRVVAAAANPPPLPNIHSYENSLWRETLMSFDQSLTFMTVQEKKRPSLFMTGHFFFTFYGTNSGYLS